MVCTVHCVFCMDYALWLWLGSFLSWLSWAYYFHLVVCVLTWHFSIKSAGRSPLYGLCYCSLLWSELLDTRCLVVGVDSALFHSCVGRLSSVPCCMWRVKIHGSWLWGLRTLPCVSSYVWCCLYIVLTVQLTFTVLSLFISPWYRHWLYSSIVKCKGNCLEFGVLTWPQCFLYWGLRAVMCCVGL